MLKSKNAHFTMGLPLLSSDASDETRKQWDLIRRIEDFLNYAGRGRLVGSSWTTRKDWVNALGALHSKLALISPRS
jgi:hypothetical protein